MNECDGTPNPHSSDAVHAMTYPLTEAGDAGSTGMRQVPNSATIIYPLLTRSFWCSHVTSEGFNGCLGGGGGPTAVDDGGDNFFLVGARLGAKSVKNERTMV
jgi:hypothetical protein